MLCSMCLMPSTRPDTEFREGVCSACLAYEKRKDIDWEARKEQLEDLLDEHHGECIVPSSGGKDSHWQALMLKELGAHVTAVTATTCHLTPIGRRNLDNLAWHVPTIEVTPNKQVRATLNRLALRLLGDISWPEHVLIHTVPWQIAIDTRHTLIFYGENPLNSYGGPLDLIEEQRMTRRWTQEFGGFLGMRGEDFVGMEGIRHVDMEPYVGMSDKTVREKAIDVFFLGQFLPWDSHRNAAVACANGFEASAPTPFAWWAFENLDNAQTGIHDLLMEVKYGYPRAAPQLSVDIRMGRLTRDVAQGYLEQRVGHFPEVYAGVGIDEVLDRIDMTREEFDTIVEEWRYASCARDTTAAET